MLVLYLQRVPPRPRAPARTASGHLPIAVDYPSLGGPYYKFDSLSIWITSDGGILDRYWGICCVCSLMMTWPR